MWLRAKQRRDRWDEEVQQCAADLAMMTNWFLNEANKWEEKGRDADEKGRKGLACYAYGKRYMWRQFWTKASAHQPAVNKYFLQIQ